MSAVLTALPVPNISIQEYFEMGACPKSVMSTSKASCSP